MLERRVSSAVALLREQQELPAAPDARRLDAGRDAMTFMFTTLLLRPDQPPDDIGPRFDLDSRPVVWSKVFVWHLCCDDSQQRMLA